MRGLAGRIFCVRTLLNVIWFVLSGFWLFLGYAAAGIVLCVLIITIPWGIASFRIGVYALWPFGRTVVAKPTSGAFSFLGNAGAGLARAARQGDRAGRHRRVRSGPRPPGVTPGWVSAALSPSECVTHPGFAPSDK